MAVNDSLPAVVRAHLLRLCRDLGFQELFPDKLMEEGFADLELGLGQLLADVERAHRRNVPLGVAVHAHEQYPYLGWFHGSLQDAYRMALPAELIPIMRRMVHAPPPSWVGETLENLCVVARSDRARPEEAALARLLIFEGIRVNLSIAAYRTNGEYEALGGDARELDEIADKQLETLLAIPLAVDATTEYRPFTTTVAAAMVRLRERVDEFWSTQALIAELRELCAQRQRLEMLLRQADPKDAAVLRNHFDRPRQRQPIPVARLPLEHPLILACETEDSLNKRTSRSVEKVLKNHSALACRPRPVTIAQLILEMEMNDA